MSRYYLTTAIDYVNSKPHLGHALEKIAADVSDAPSKANGGLIGPISMNDLSPDLRNVIETMKVGDMSPVLRTPRGYQLLKVESVSDTTLKTVDDAKGEISDKIANDKRAGEYTKYIEKLRSDAIIDWKNDEIKKAYEVGLKLPRASAQ